MLEKQVNEHLQSTYDVWDQLPPQRKNEVWTLELARSVARREKEVEKLKERQHYFKQENANLKTQIDQLNRLQQPREFRVMPPATIPFDQHMIEFAAGMGVKGAHGVGLNMDDRHVDLSTVTSRAIERWKSVVVAAKGSGMNQQRPLDQPTPTSAVTTPTPVGSAQPKSSSQQQQGSQQANQMVPITNGPLNDARSTTTGTTNSVSNANDDNSDEDADAEMEEDDTYAAPPVNNPIVAKAPEQQQQQQQQLQVPRTRANMQRSTSTPGTMNHNNNSNNTNNQAQYMLNATTNMGANRALNMSMSRGTMQSINTAAMQQQAQHNGMANANFGTAVQGIGSNTEPMYMD